MNAAAGHDHSTVTDFATDLQAHGGDIVSAAFAKDVCEALPDAAVSYDRFRTVAMAQEAMSEVRRAEVGCSARPCEAPGPGV